MLVGAIYCPGHEGDGTDRGDRYNYGCDLVFEVHGWDVDAVDGAAGREIDRSLGPKPSWQNDYQ
jgi:hypothetical protein